MPVSIVKMLAVTVAVIAASYDWKQYRIPNAVNYSALLCGLLIAGVWPTTEWAFALALLGLAIGGGLSLILYQAHMIGGGDVKLLAALGALLGAAAVIDIMFYAIVLAWPVALVMLVRNRLAPPTEDNDNKLLRFPFAVAIASAVLLIVFVPSVRISPELGKIFGLS